MDGPIADVKRLHFDVSVSLYSNIINVPLQQLHSLHPPSSTVYVYNIPADNKHLDLSAN